jgi:A/G-specific adenine glycosylase
MLFARRPDGSVRLVKRPARGIWGGLWSPPEFPDRAALENLYNTGSLRDAPQLQHVFTHFDLLIRPVWTDVAPAATVAAAAAVADDSHTLWYNPARPAKVGLPAPVAQLLDCPPP